MTLSLLKATATNVSGTYTPNCLLNGFFDLTLGGDVTVAAPTNCGDGQLFAVKISSGGNTHAVAWDSAYVSGTMYPLDQSDPGYYGVNLFMYFAGTCIMINNTPVQLE